jgi:hypothetical protein
MQILHLMSLNLFLTNIYLHKVRCIPRPAVCFRMSRPTPVEPENVNFETALCVTRSRPISESPGKTLITPGGKLKLKIMNYTYSSHTKCNSVHAKHSD